MKKEELLDVIGEAPDKYIKDAKEYKKRRIPTWTKWMSGIAAVLAVVILVNNMPGIPLIISAKEISAASDSRKPERPNHRNGDDYDEWRAELDIWIAENEARSAVVDEASVPISEFSELVSVEVLGGDDDTNRVWSPINAYIALAMTAELTANETQAQLFDILGVSDTAELRSRVSAVWEQIYEDNGKEISVLANSLWLDNDINYVQDKMDILAYDYYASVYQGDLGSDRTNRDMTNWMRNQTGGMLKDRTGSIDLGPNDQMIALASTIYFQSKWVDEFSSFDNTEGVFHAPSGDITTTFMNKEEYRMNYYWGEDYSAVKMYLENSSAMFFILPDEGKTIDDVLESGEYAEMLAENEFYSDSVDNVKYMKVNLSVPKFDVSSGIDLKEGLKSIGLTDIFEPYVCDFSPSILPSDGYKIPPFVASINQDTRVKIDEEGVAAASYIEIVGAGSAMPPEEIIDFVLDRPFIFAVVKDQMPLFMGTVNMP